MQLEAQLDCGWEKPNQGDSCFFTTSLWFPSFLRTLSSTPKNSHLQVSYTSMCFKTKDCSTAVPFSFSFLAEFKEITWLLNQMPCPWGQSVSCAGGRKDCMMHPGADLSSAEHSFWEVSRACSILLIRLLIPNSALLNSLVSPRICQ